MRQNKVMYKLAEECVELAAELLKACNKQVTDKSLIKIRLEIDDVEKQICKLKSILEQSTKNS